MTKRGAGLRLLAAMFAALLVAVATLAASGCGNSGEENASEEAVPVENALHEIAKEGFERRALFEEPGEEPSSGEAERGGPRSPAAEAVANRAYPRNYVDDARAEKTLRAFQQIPAEPSASAFDDPAALRAARTKTNWKELGPFTPKVPGEPSQFFDPDTQTGPSTEESGRVAAMAIDPACVPGDCSMAVAAAGGGIWHTNDALAAQVNWQAPPNDLPTTAFGSLYYDDANGVLYAGSGEPNGSSDSEAGLGLFKSTNFGASWTQVPGSEDVAINRSIGAIAVDPTDPDTIYIGTALARHGSSSVNGGRRTPPDAPTLGVYRSTDGGQTFSLEEDLAGKALPDPTPPSTGVDFFQGGISKLIIDPNDPDQLYAAVFGYGIWRADQSAGNPTWEQVFHTMNQNDLTGDEFVGDSTGDETEFDLVDTGATTRMFVGDASDDWAVDGDDETPFPRAWRNDDIAAIAGDPDGMLPPTDPMGDTFNTGNGFVELSSDDPADPGFAVYNYCQNGQCSYDSLVAHPPGAPASDVWYLGSMNYDELKVYDRDGLGLPPRSNGRAVIRSTNAGGAVPGIEWQDMTAVLDNPPTDWNVKAGIHPDLRAAAFADNGNIAFIGGDGGVTRVDLSSTQDQSSSCAQRTWDYDGDGTEEPLEADDLALCQMLLSAVPDSIVPVNDGLRTLQFQSLSVNPSNPSSQIFGGTQDNGTWSFDSSRSQADRWFETVGGDGGQSGFGRGQVRFHNYYDATPEVNFQADDPKTWLDIYDPLQLSDEARSFYTPFEVDPTTKGRLFTGMQHVWRTDDNGGDEQELIDNGCLAVALDPFREQPCGDWVEMGGDLTSTAYGNSRAGDYVVATERAPSDDGTLWAATRTGRLFVTSNADDVPGSVSFRRIDTNEDAGAVRDRDRDRSARPEPRVGLLHRLRRLHAEHAGPCLRGHLRPRHPQGEVQGPVLEPRRSADHRHRALRQQPEPVRGDRLRRPRAALRLEAVGRGGQGAAEGGHIRADRVRQWPGALRGYARARRLLAEAGEDEAGGEAEERQEGQGRQEVEDPWDGHRPRRRRFGDRQLRRRQPLEGDAEGRRQLQAQASLREAGQVRGDAEGDRLRGRNRQGDEEGEGQEEVGAPGAGARSRAGR